MTFLKYLMDQFRKTFGRLGNNLFQGAYIYSQMRKGLIPDIFVQSDEYFKEYADEIKALFGQDIGERTSKVAIHVRRGDYIKNSFYVDLTQTDYYERAMVLFPKSTFLVFSDDIDWCKEQEIFKDCAFSEGNSEVQDLNLMASCTEHIIANSSYSYWGSWLSPYSKKTVAPNKEHWYTDGIERTVCPNSWIRL
jgi:hypothetical protein